MGGTFWARLCRPSMGKFGANRPFAHVLNVTVPQTKAKMLRISQGIHAWTTRSRCSAATGAAAGGGMVDADSSRTRSAVEVHSTLGCQTLRKPMRQAIDT